MGISIPEPSRKLPTDLLPHKAEVADDTYDELVNLGKKNETFDSVVKKCIVAYKKMNKLRPDSKLGYKFWNMNQCI